MNVISIAGFLGKDAECRKTQNGKTIVSFSVAVSEGKDATTWFECASSQERHEKLSASLKKGNPIAVTGRMQFKKVEDGRGYYHTLWVNDITSLGSKEKKEEKPTQSPPDYDSDLPF